MHLLKNLVVTETWYLLTFIKSWCFLVAYNVMNTFTLSQFQEEQLVSHKNSL